MDFEEEVKEVLDEEYLEWLADVQHEEMMLKN